MEVKLLHSALFVCMKISIDYGAIDESQQGKPSGVSVDEFDEDTWMKWWIC